MSIQRPSYFSVSSSRVPIRNIADYSPFGVQLDGRTIQGDFYRRGFNGMEKDDEVKGGGNSYTTEFRQYDVRVGRWLSLDPLASTYPYCTPYSFVANCVTSCTDTKGDKVRPINNSKTLFYELFAQLSDMGFNTQIDNRGFVSISETPNIEDIKSFSDFKENAKSREIRDRYGKLTKLNNKELKAHYALLIALRSEKEIELQYTIVGNDNSNQNFTFNNENSSNSKEGTGAGDGGIYTNSSEFQEFYSALIQIGTLTQDLSDELYKGGIVGGVEITPDRRFDENSAYFESDTNPDMGMIIMDITKKTIPECNDQLSKCLSSLLNIKFE